MSKNNESQPRFNQIPRAVFEQDTAIIRAAWSDAFDRKKIPLRRPDGSRIGVLHMCAETNDVVGIEIYLDGELERDVQAHFASEWFKRQIESKEESNG